MHKRDLIILFSNLFAFINHLLRKIRQNSNVNGQNSIAIISLFSSIIVVLENKSGRLWRITLIKKFIVNLQKKC